MTTASIKPYIARLIKTDDLDALLIQWDADGLSPGAMAKKIRILADSPDGTVHRDTVARWLVAAKKLAAENERRRLVNLESVEEEARRRRKEHRAAMRRNRKPRAKKATA